LKYRLGAAAAALVLLLGLMPAAAGAAGGEWQQQGPGPAAGGGSEGISSPVNNPITGAIETVVAHPSNVNIVWIGATNGGVFRTNNATALSPNWTAQTDNQTSLSIGALELDPTDGTHNTLVAGLGRTSSFAGEGGSRSGILRTTNGGTSWTLLSNGLTGQNLRGVAARGAIIVVASDQSDSGDDDDVGIYRSTNTGASFTQLSGNGISGLPFGVAFDLVGDSTKSSRLFAVIADLVDGENSGIYRSEDTGATWTKVSDAAQDDLLNAFPVNAELAVGKAGPTTPNVYAAICTEEGQLALGGLFRTGNGAAAAPTWTVLDDPGTIEEGEFVGTHPGKQCSPHLSLAADPSNPQVAFIGGDSVTDVPASLGNEDFSGRLFRIHAGLAPGIQVTPITHCATPTFACGGAVRTVNNSSPHADSREMVFDAQGKILQTDDGGIYKHTDPNGSTGDWVSLIGNLPVTETHDSIYDGISKVNLSGLQDNGTTLQNTLGDLGWGSTAGGDGGDVAVAEDQPSGGACSGTPPCSTRYWSVQNFGGASRNVYDSNNTLQDAFDLALVPLSGDPDPEPQFVTPQEVNGADPARLILGADNGVYESTDELDTVRLISPATINAAGGDAIAYGTTGNANVLYFGSEDRVFVRTAAAPAVPANTDPDAASDDFITGVDLVPGSTNDAFAVDRDQVFRTTNAGGSWSDITGNLVTSLNPGTLRSIAYVARATGDGLVVGTDRGVYLARQGSGFTSWEELGTGLPNAPVYELDDHPVDDLLAAGTLGRGTWTLSPVLPEKSEGGCTPSDTVACVDLTPGDNRFQIEVKFKRVAADPYESAHALSLSGLGVARGALFWFFSERNPEIVVKVLNAAALKRIWVFYAGGTNVGTEVKVTDTDSGQSKIYTNAAGHPLLPVQDTFAFNSDGTPGPPYTPTEVSFDFDDNYVQSSVAPSTCVPSDTVTCILDRFEVKIDYFTTQGGGDGLPHPGKGIALAPIGVDRGSLYSFFNETNPEVLVKVLNGCPTAFNRHWVFFSAVTNVGYDLTVTDTVAGIRNVYHNDDRSPAPPVQHTMAFPCP
jgi:hypothetical protein